MTQVFPDFVPFPKAITYSTVQVTINAVKYAVQSKIIESLEGSIKSEYRVFLEGSIIKDWTEGDIEKYFGIAHKSE